VAKHQTGIFKASMTIDIADLSKFLDERRSRVGADPTGASGMVLRHPWP
jgi:hypothetical protein